MYGGGGGGHYDGGGGGHYDGGGGGGGHYDGGGAGNANSLFSGGGFMPSQSTAVPENSGISKGRSAQTLLPLTAKQIMDAVQSSDDRSNFAVDGVEVSTVRLVGRMLNKVQRFTDAQFTLDDGTGKIDVSRWENESSDVKEMADVNDGDYVIVNGGLKGFQGKRHIVAYSVRRVTNFNEITHHFLHCIEVHLHHTRPKAQINAIAATPGHTNHIPLSNNQTAPLSASENAAGNDISKLVLSVFLEPEFARVTNFNEITHHFLHCIEVHLCDTRSKAQINASAAIPGHTNQVQLSNNKAAPFSASGNAAGNDISKLVLSVFNEPAVLGLEHGPDIKDVAARLNLSVVVVRAAIEKHLENGDIYNTIDDNHFRSAMNG